MYVVRSVWQEDDFDRALARVDQLYAFDDLRELELMCDNVLYTSEGKTDRNVCELSEATGECRECIVNYTGRTAVRCHWCVRLRTCIGSSPFSSMLMAVG